MWFYFGRAFAVPLSNEDEANKKHELKNANTTLA